MRALAWTPGSAGATTVGITFSPNNRACLRDSACASNTIHDNLAICILVLREKRRSPLGGAVDLLQHGQDFVHGTGRHGIVNRLRFLLGLDELALAQHGEVL